MKVIKAAIKRLRKEIKSLERVRLKFIRQEDNNKLKETTEQLKKGKASLSRFLSIIENLKPPFE